MPNQIHIENSRNSRPALRRAQFSLFALLFVLFFCFVVNAAAQSPINIWNSTATPVVADTGDTKAVELGVKFTSSQAGSITGIRFYKSAANTGTHIGNLSTTSGTQLASAVFTNESASGWQQVNFSSPVAIAANTTYIASYYAPLGHYADDRDFFTTTAVNNPPLQAVANSVTPNGVYKYGAQSAFPNTSTNPSNYWVDVVFSSTVAAATSVWSPTAQPVLADTGDTKAVELGMKFTSSQAGSITGIRFYKSAANTGAHIGNLWTTGGTLLATAAFTNESASGWQQVNFSSPVAISANTTYVVSYYAPLGHYADDRDFFTSTAVNNPPLQAVANTVTPNGVYKYGAQSAFPNTSTNPSNYWVDVVFRAGSSTGQVANLSPISLTFAAQTVGATSAAQTITLNNTGNAALSLNSFAVTGANSGDFAQTTTCGVSVAAGASCTFTVTFKPTTSGTRTAALTLTDSAPNSPQTVSLTGTGATVVTAPVITSATTGSGTAGSAFSYQITAINSPSSYAAAGLPAGLTLNSATGLISGTPTGAATSTVTLSATNSGGTGNGTLTLTIGLATPVVTSATTASGTVASAFSYQITASNTPSSYAAAGLPAGLTVNSTTGLISGTPTAAATSTVTLSATNSSGTGNRSLTLTIAGASAAGASLSTSSLNFGNAPVAVTTSSQVVTLTNTGNAALSITGIAFTGTNAAEFNQVTTCGTSVAAGAKCTIAVLFTPSLTGTRTATLTIADNASGSPQAVSLSGTGTHSMILTWNYSTSAGVTGYNVFRGMTSGGEGLTPLNSTPINGNTYADVVVTAGTKYYYVVTAVASTQSAKSNETSATVLMP